MLIGKSVTLLKLKSSFEKGLMKWSADVNHTLKSWDVSDAALRKLKKYCKRLTGIYIVSTVFTKKKLQWEEIKDDES